MLLYVAGPYRGDVARNIQQAREIAIKLWEAGHVAICPHLNTAHFEVDAQLTDETYLDGDIQILARCDGIVLTPDWENSQGARGEQAYAESQGMPIWVWPNMPKLHPTEVRCPKQAKAYIETLLKMYRLHLAKNADYSPNNVKGPGEIGVAVRIWDKVQRYMNLIGFRFDVSVGTFEAPRAPAHESIDDTLLDLACYGVIGLLLRQRAWGE